MSQVENEKLLNPFIIFNDLKNTQRYFWNETNNVKYFGQLIKFIVFSVKPFRKHLNIFTLHIFYIFLKFIDGFTR